MAVNGPIALPHAPADIRLLRSLAPLTVSLAVMSVEPPARHGHDVGLDSVIDDRARVGIVLVAQFGLTLYDCARPDLLTTRNLRVSVCTLGGIDEAEAHRTIALDARFVTGDVAHVAPARAVRDRHALHRHRYA